MTLKQLLAETYALGFEDGAELDDAFLFAANRAIRLISTEHMNEKEGVFIIPPAHLSYYAESLSGTDEMEVHIKGRGMAYSFRALGSGTLFIKDGNATRAELFSDSKSPFQGIINNRDAEFTFISSGAFSIMDFAIFDSLYSKDKIPIMEKKRTFDIREQIKDFSYAVGAATAHNGREIRDVEIKGENLIAPRNFSGEILIRYKPLPQEISGDDKNELIPLPHRCLHLCPILTAAYLWLDDDEEKAAYYMQIYREESGKLRMLHPKSVNCAYKDIAGWT